MQYSVPDSPRISKYSVTSVEESRHQIDEPSLEPWRYLLGLPGKNMRDQFIDAFAIWVSSSSSNLVLVKQIIGYLHTASLMIDDIEDGSDKRRGFPASHIVHGKALTINAANYVYFLALEKTLSLENATDASAIYAQEILNLHRGQGQDIWWREKTRVPTESEYISMVKDKTGGLFRMAVRLLCCSFSLDNAPSGNTTLEKMEAMLELCDLLAVYFQIRDDFINVFSTKIFEQKGFAEDLTEGKYSFLVVSAVRTLREAKNDLAVEELLSILTMHSTDAPTKKRAIELLNLGQASAYTRQYLAETKSDIALAIGDLGGNASMMKILDMLEKDLLDGG